MTTPFDLRPLLRAGWFLAFAFSVNAMGAEILRTLDVKDSQIRARYELPSQTNGLKEGDLFDIYRAMETLNLQGTAVGYVATVAYLGADKTNLFFRTVDEETRWLVQSNMVLIPNGRHMDLGGRSRIKAASSVSEKPFCLYGYSEIALGSGLVHGIAGLDARLILSGLYLGLQAGGNYLTGPGFGAWAAVTGGFVFPFERSIVSRMYLDADIGLFLLFSGLRGGVGLAFEFNSRWLLAARFTATGIIKEGGTGLQGTVGLYAGYRIF